MDTYKEAPLKPEILRALEDLGFESPTPIQKAVLEQFEKEFKDCIALAQTGTGKTAAFSLPILNTIEAHEQDVQALILSPTRELALQISNDIHSFAKYLPGISNLAVYGGTSIMQQIKTLRGGPQIVVGTPGRTKDLIDRGKLKLGNAKWIILDEADEMLSMGFKEDLDYILSHLPDERTVMLFSATLPPEISRITKKYLKDPIEITVGNKNQGAKNVSHQYYMVKRSDKYQALKRVLDLHPDIYSIVFCRTKAETNEIAEKLARDGYNSDTLNGDLKQAQRDHVMNKFRQKQVQILVATDVAARGLDVNDLTHVINFQLPDEREAYVHRSGRTGRAGKLGISLSIITPRDIGKIKNIERMLGKTIEHMLIPFGNDILKAQLYHYIDRLRSTKVDHGEITDFMPGIEEMLSDLSKEDLIKKFVSMEFNKLLAYYKGSEDINATKDSRREKSSKKDRRSRNSDLNYTRYFLNVGSKDRFQKRHVLELVNKILPVRGVDIGEIEILQTFSFIELEEGYEKVAMDAFKNTNFKGRKLSLEIATEKKGRSKKKRKDRPKRSKKKK